MADHAAAKARFDRIERATDLPMAVLALLIVPALILEESAQSAAVRHRQFHYVALTTIVVIALGAIGIFAVEHGENKAIGSLGDAFWWAIVTTTTVGYGDVSPVTTEGRLIAVALMVVGIGFIGVL